MDFVDFVGLSVVECMSSSDNFVKFEASVVFVELDVFESFVEGVGSVAFEAFVEVVLLMSWEKMWYCRNEKN